MANIPDISLLSMTWIRPDTSAKHDPDAEYACDSLYVYERIPVPNQPGKYSHRRAHWSRIVVTCCWHHIPNFVWEEVNDSDPQRVGPEP